MNFYKKTYAILIAFILISISANAQIKFKLILLEDGKTYQVSLMPEVNFQPPLNVTSTGQVTLKVPTGGFNVDQMTSIQPDVIWERNSRTESPKESPEYDYISFGLVSQGTKNLNYIAGEEIPLFTFVNGVECQGEITLIDNLNDAFAPPNSKQVNVGNQITILGAKGDAYIGNVTESTVPCNGNLTAIEDIDYNSVQLSIYPNPAKDYISLNMEWDRKGQKVELILLNMMGKVVLTKSIQINLGENQEKLDINQLAQGNYFLELRGKDWKISSEQFFKAGL